MIDTETTRHLADLSKIAFTDEELTAMTEQMRDIVGLMDTIADFDASGDAEKGEPVAYSDFREDRHTASFPRDEILANATERGETCFRVPKVV